MIDFHTHIIPNIDDGSRSEEETNSLLLEACNAGFDKIISTSHYYVSRYEANVAERKKSLKSISENFNMRNNKNMEFFLGNEIFIVPNIIELILECKASTINMTRYTLIELPLRNEVYNVKEILYSLLEKKCKPVIAHPERYKVVQENPNYLIDLIEMGVLFQSNYASIIGYYGSEAKKTVKKLLQANMIHFLGSDAHREGTIYPEIPKILKELEKIVGEKRLKELTTLNAEKILKDEDLEAYQPSEIKKGLFSF